MIICVVHFLSLSSADPFVDGLALRRDGLTRLSVPGRPTFAFTTISHLNYVSFAELFEFGADRNHKISFR